MTRPLLPRELADLKRRVRALEAAPQLGHSSIEDGAITEYDRDGQLVGSIGKQPDGSHAHVILDGPTPLQTTDPIVVGRALAIEVAWDGVLMNPDTGTADPSLTLFEDTEALEAHVGATEGFIPSPETHAGELLTRLGGRIEVPCPAGDYWVRWVVRSKARKFGPPSVSVPVTVETLVDQQQFDDLRADLDEAADWISLSGAELGANLAQAQIDLRAAEARLADAEGSLDNLNTVTLPGLTDTLDAAQQRLDTAFGAGESYSVSEAVDVARQAAITAAAVTAQNKADAAQAAAEAAAATHAELVASGAEQAAIDAAAITAQQKADAAKDAAEAAAKIYTDGAVSPLITRLTAAEDALGDLDETTLPALSVRVGEAESALEEAFPTGAFDVDSQIQSSASAVATAAALDAQNKADAAASAAQTAAQQYAAGQITEAELRAAQDAADKAEDARLAAIQAAEGYTDTQASAAQQAAISAAATYADTKKAEAITAAAADAATKATAAQQAAEDAAAIHAQLVADGAEQAAIDAAAITAQQKATAAETAAKTYADAQATAAETAAKTHADTQATAAKNEAIQAAAADALTKANTAKQAAIDAAATHAQLVADGAEQAAIDAAAITAQQKADAAQAAAEAAAQTKADAAKNAAIDAAAITAQTKADVAKQAAIDAAALDATAKANAAKAVANQAVADAAAASQAALDAAGLAGSKGEVIVQTSAPTGARAVEQNLWIRLPDNIPHRWNPAASGTNKWQPITDKTAADAATAAAAAQARAEAVKTEAIAAAATDATTKANNAKSQAIAAAATDAQTKADAAKAAAEQAAKDYADGEIDASALAVAQAAATDAQNKATAAKNAAITAAATDATTKANDAKAAAITAAAADATTKANNAKAAAEAAAATHAEAEAEAARLAAISAASGDATDKANAAQAAAEATAAADALAKANAALAAAKIDATNKADAAAAVGAAAQTTANAALASADGKNTNTYSNVTTIPGATPTVAFGAGRRQFDTHRNRLSQAVTVNGVVTPTGTVVAEWMWTGSAWTPVHLGDAMLRSLDVGKITAGTANVDTAVINKLAVAIATVIELNASRITAGQIGAARIDVSNLAAAMATIIQLDAARITSGTINAARIDVADLAASIATVIQLNANRITSGTIDAARINVEQLAVSIASIIELDVSKLIATTATLDTSVINKLWTDVVRSRKITTDMLVVGSGNNLIPDPQFLNVVEGWFGLGAGLDIHPTGARNGGPALRIMNNASQQLVYVRPYEFVKAVPGESFRFMMSVRNGGMAIPANAVGLGVRWKLGNGNELWDWAGNDYTPAYTWQRSEKILTAPDNVISASVYFASNASLSSGELLVDQVSMTSATNASLIVDGTIQGRHVAAESVAAEIGEFVEVKAENILAGNVNVALNLGVNGQIQIGSNTQVHIIAANNEIAVYEPDRWVGGVDPAWWPGRKFMSLGGVSNASEPGPVVSAYNVEDGKAMGGLRQDGSMFATRVDADEIVLDGQELMPLVKAGFVTRGYGTSEALHTGLTTKTGVFAVFCPGLFRKDFQYRVTVHWLMRVEGSAWCDVTVRERSDSLPPSISLGSQIHQHTYPMTQGVGSTGLYEGREVNFIWRPTNTDRTDVTFLLCLQPVGTNPVVAARRYEMTVTEEGPALPDTGYDNYVAPPLKKFVQTFDLTPHYPFSQYGAVASPYTPHRVKSGQGGSSNYRTFLPMPLAARNVFTAANSVDKVEIFLKQSDGYYNAAPRIGTTTATSYSASTTIANEVNAPTSFSPGDGKWFTVPAAIAAALAAGARTFVVGSRSSGYAFQDFYGPGDSASARPKIRITSWR